MTGQMQSRAEWLDEIAAGETTNHSIQDEDMKADYSTLAVVERTITDLTIGDERGTPPVESKHPGDRSGEGR